MGLESTMICVDTSDFMRNGDFVPTRLQAQQEAVHLLCRSKARQHPENDVGLLAMADANVLVTLTTDVERVLITVNKQSPHGALNFSSALKVAQLALKHRREKRHKMRIVAFVGSPIAHSEEEVVTLARNLRKGNVSVDVVNFGTEAEEANGRLLASFIDTLNGKDGTSCHLLTVTSGPFLTGPLLSSPIVVGEGGAALPGDDVEWGVDANEDPELALALKMSLAEQRRFEEQAGRQTGLQKQPDPQGSASAMNPSYMTEEEQIAYGIHKPPNGSETSSDNIQYIVLSEEEFLRLFGHLFYVEDGEEENIEEDVEDKHDENDRENTSDKK